MGLLEVKNYQLTNEDYQCKFMNYAAELVELENSVTMEYNVLRYWVTPSLLETLNKNKHYDYPQNIFEIGTVFRINDNYETKVQENERLAIAFCGNDANFTKVKQALESLMSALDVKYSVVETEHSSFIKGRVGRVKVNDEKIALIGEIHPQVLMNWSLDMPTAVIELNITDIFRMMHLPTEVVIEHTHVEETHKKHSKKEHVHIAAKKTITRKHVVKKNSAHKPIKKKTVSHSKKSKKKK